MNKPAIFVRSQQYPSLSVQYPLYEFHIQRTARKKYDISNTLFESTGNVIFPNFREVRNVAYSINRIRGVLESPDRQVRAGYLNAAGLLDEITHFLMRIYDEQENPGVIHRAYRYVEQHLGKIEWENVLIRFLQEFPPTSVYRHKETVREYFNRSTNGRPHKEITLEELTTLYLTNLNPAMKKIKELFDDTGVADGTQYYAAFAVLDTFFKNEKPFGPDGQHFLSALRAPIVTHPENIEAQIGFLKEKWGIILTPKFLDRIDSSFEFISEEEKFIGATFNKFGGRPTVETVVPEYKSRQSLSEEERKRIADRSVRPEDFIYDEPQQFTQDIEWMPNVVILAKNTYVWLDQLTKKFGRPIKRLDEIPDEELDMLARWNFTGLWLIGVWERSSASKKIKQINGNLDAVSSAYSLYEYEIAGDIGGEEAFQNLNQRAWQRGIRLAGDMVPNHMGLYSKWIVEHPEYFIQTEHSPYPNYRFTGHNLSEHPDIEIRIEDAYWTRSDAAVVFQRIDKRTGEVRYMYHGNDGTSMPWNDTAQLNLLRADVREAIIQNILHVAHKFSIIRFDAAMTLAKKHYHRLWFPMPGTSGVPSRQDHSLRRAEFDELFPKEFWREVVDRFNTEMPQTLLLAEAFWLMEGYFVRTLGMHRVYNSAFMHMLMKEENVKFRALIKNTLEFNPEILKRYINFMSNPDEQTAIEQFGKDDKYFGVATMMVTLPGLPMFAHGQVEGYKEKYGMEYQRAYYHETPDHWLVRRHEEEIFPLIRKRYIFSQVQQFEFYDFYDEKGFLNENVFAYSNRAGEERALIFFHNVYAETTGSIHLSVPKADGEGGNKRSVMLGQALGLNGNDRYFYKFRDRHSGLEFLVAGKKFYNEGWRIHLRAFHYAVFTDFVELVDEKGEFQLIADQLHGEGCSSVDRLVHQIHLKPLQEMIHQLFQDETGGDDRFITRYTELIDATKKYFKSEYDMPDQAKNMTFARSCIDRFSDGIKSHSFPSATMPEKAVLLSITTLYQFVIDIYHILVKGKPNSTVRDVISELALDRSVEIFCEQWNKRSAREVMTPVLFGLLLKHHMILSGTVTDSALLDILLNDFESADFLGVNQHEDIWYYNKEKLDLLILWVKIIHFLEANAGSISHNPFNHEMDRFVSTINKLKEISDRSGYQVEKLKDAVVAYSLKSGASQQWEQGSGSKQKRRRPGTPKRRKASNVNNITKKGPSH